MQVFMTASKQSGCSTLTLLGSGHQNLHKTCGELLMMGKEDARNM
jgi:hypothetical protein